MDLAQVEHDFPLTPAQLGSAMVKAWMQGYGKGFDAGEDYADKKQLKAL